MNAEDSVIIIILMVIRGSPEEDKETEGKNSAAEAMFETQSLGRESGMTSSLEKGWGEQRGLLYK